MEIVTKARFVYNEVDETFVVIARDKDTFCKPDLQAHPNRFGVYPHLVGSGLNHLDVISPTASKQMLRTDISGARVYVDISGTTIVFPYQQDLKVFLPRMNCTATATTSGAQVWLTATPAGLYWVTGRQ